MCFDVEAQIGRPEAKGMVESGSLNPVKAAQVVPFAGGRPVGKIAYRVHVQRAVPGNLAPFVVDEMGLHQDEPKLVVQERKNVRLGGWTCWQ